MFKILKLLKNRLTISIIYCCLRKYRSTFYNLLFFLDINIYLILFYWVNFLFLLKYSFFLKPIFISIYSLIFILRWFNIYSWLRRNIFFIINGLIFIFFWLLFFLWIIKRNRLLSRYKKLYFCFFLYFFFWYIK